MSNEFTPLLQPSERTSGSRNELLGDHHTQFCQLVGTRPHNLPPDQTHNPHPHSLYVRAVSQRDKQKYTYMFTATLTNTFILSEVVLGATITGLAASNSNHILVTIFGALNTIIAGLIAFLKSRGQPMRAHMFRDDLERVVDEIENSAVMWLGISKGSHGYDAIDTDDQVTVRSEVARLTRLYDKAVKTNTLNDPDMYSTGGPGDLHSAAMRNKSAAVAPVPAPAPLPSASAAAALTAAPVPQDTDDASPATKPPEPAKPQADDSSTKDTNDEASGSKGVNDAKDEIENKGGPVESSSRGEDSSAPAAKSEDQTKKLDAIAQPSPAAPNDPDESPASTAHPKTSSQMS